MGDHGLYLFVDVNAVMGRGSTVDRGREGTRMYIALKIFDFQGFYNKICSAPFSALSRPTEDRDFP